MGAKPTGIAFAPVSLETLSASSVALSASSVFQKQTNPVPLDRPVSLSIVNLAYRNGPNERNLDAVSYSKFRETVQSGLQCVELVFLCFVRKVSDEQS